MREHPTRRTAVWPVIVVVGLFAVFGVIFLVEFINLSRGDGSAQVLTPDTYMDIVAPLLAGADPANGPALIQRHGCAACHEGNSAGRLAPGYADLAERAGERRPPLTAAAYIYESIIYPGAYTVEGYQNNMPRLYESQIPPDELRDIIAYLLSGDAE